MAAMAKPRAQPSSYLAEARLRRGLKASQVLIKLRKGGFHIPRSTFSRWEQGARHCPVRIQWELAKLYREPFLTVLTQTEGLPEEAIVTNPDHGTMETLPEEVTQLMLRWLGRIHPEVLAALFLIPQETQLEILETVLRPAVARHARAREMPGKLEAG